MGQDARADAVGVASREDQQDIARLEVLDEILLVFREGCQEAGRGMGEVGHDLGE